jgi:hypothetical protein
MSGYADGFEPYEDADAADEFEDAFYDDPVGTIGAVVNQAAADVAAQVSAQVEQTAAIARAERMTTVVREAGDAMTEKYGAGWEQHAPSVADELRVDVARGVLPTDDALTLARHIERIYLAERERGKPSADEQNAAYWERVKANAPSADEYTLGLG